MITFQDYLSPFLGESPCLPQNLNLALEILLNQASASFSSTC